MVPQSKTASARSLGDLNIGVSLFDTAHAELASFIDRFCEDYRTSPSGAYVESRFEMLQQKISRHFLHEEEYMRHSGYPQSAAHSKDHARMTNLLKKLFATTDFTNRAEQSVPPAIRQFFDETLPTHIVDHDRAFGAYLNSKGIR